MTSASLTSIAVFLWLSGPAVQAPPELSGTWRLDPARSDSATYPELSRPMTLVITQTPDEVRIDTTTTQGTVSEVAQFSAKDVAVAAGAVARWRGRTLLIDAIRDVRGQSVTVHRALTPLAGGRELIVESTVNVQHGYSLGGAKVYGAGRDVFVRVQ